MTSALDELARLAVETPKPEQESDTYTTSLLAEAQRELAVVGFADNARLAAAISLAKAEERALRVSANGHAVPHGIKREIETLKDFLN